MSHDSGHIPCLQPCPLTKMQAIRQPYSHILSSPNCVSSHLPLPSNFCWFSFHCLHSVLWTFYLIVNKLSFTLTVVSYSLSPLSWWILATSHRSFSLQSSTDRSPKVLFHYQGQNSLSLKFVRLVEPDLHLSPIKINCPQNAQVWATLLLEEF